MWIYVKTIGHTAAASVYKMRQALIEEQAQRIAALEAEIARLKGPKKPASNSKPSALSKPTAAAPAADGKRPGSAKRSKTKDLPIHAEMPVPPKELPPGATLRRRDPFVVQDLLVKTHNTCYGLERGRRRPAP